MLIALLGVAGLAVVAPALAVWMASSTSRREETARILADRNPGYSDAVALRFWSAAMTAHNHSHPPPSAAGPRQHS